MKYLILIKKMKDAEKGGDVCNPSYSGGRDWKNHCSGPAKAKVNETPSQPGVLL
jgi:hypothetical protein